MATKKGINDIVMLLLDRGADIGSTDKVNYNEMNYLEINEKTQNIAIQVIVNFKVEWNQDVLI